MKTISILRHWLTMSVMSFSGATAAICGIGLAASLIIYVKYVRKKLL